MPLCGPDTENPGEVVAGRFEIERFVDAGGMGSVYRAVDRTTGDVVALKLLAVGADAWRFRREAELLAELRHPGIVRHVAHGTSETGQPYLAMEWLEAESLDALLARRDLTLVEVVALALRVAEALSAAHARNIVHRDLKPSNLMLENGQIERVKIIDFGIALERARAHRDTRTGIAMGTPEFMAPEQARGESVIDARADIYSLGAVLFECLTGRPPFVGGDVMAVLAKVLLEEPPHLHELRPEVPDSLDRLVASMLAKDKNDRPPDAEYVRRELEELTRDGLTARATTPSAPPVGLSSGEQLSVSVVFLYRSEAGRRALSVGDSTVDAEALPLDADAASRALDPMMDVVRRFDARAEVLLDGSVVVLLRARGTIRDLVAHAAACALGLRAVAADTPISLATGRAEVGSRLPVGDVIERAAGLAKGVGCKDGVRVDEVTAALLDERFDRLHDAQGTVLVGRRQEDRVRTLLGKPTKCLGREAELSMLDALWNQCVEEPVARAALAVGAAGVGKSRLRYELGRQLRSRGQPVEVWLARGEAMGAGAAFGMLAQIVRSTADVQEGAPLDVRRDKLAERVQRHLPRMNCHRVATFLGEMIGAPFPDENDLQLRTARRDALVMSDQIRSAWEDFVGAQCNAGPLLIVLEDLHWGDQPTIKLIDAVLRLYAEKPLMVFALARPEIDELFPDLWAERDLKRIVVAGLTRRSSERLVMTVLGEAADPALVARLVEQAGGNAFYLEELIRAAAEGSDAAPPESVVLTVQSRLEAMESDARRVLRAASVFGQVFWEAGVTALLGGSRQRTDVTRWLDELVAREVVTRRARGKFADQSELVFRHALVRDAAYAMLTDDDKKLGHLLAAKFLESAGETDAMTIAEHLERGGDRLRSVEAFARAAEQALEGNDLAAAIARVERGVQSRAEGPLLGALRRIQTDAHLWRGEIAEAERAGREALSLLEPGSEPWGDVAGATAEASARLGDLEKMVALSQELRDLLRSGRGGAGCARGAGRAAIGLIGAGLNELANELLAAAEAALISEPGQAAGASVQRARAFSALQRGRATECLERCLDAVRTFEEVGDARSACLTRANAGFSLIEVGAHLEAERMLSEALVAAERMGLGHTLAGIRQNLGRALSLLGRFSDARRVLGDAIAAFEKHGDRRMSGASRAYLAKALCDAGEPDAAEREARAAILSLEQAPPLRAYARGVLGAVMVGAGRATEALDHTRDAMAFLESQGHLEEGEILLRLAHAEALNAVGDGEGARSALAIARERLLERASAITRPDWRQSFLANIPENARTLELAKAWLPDRVAP